MVLPVLFGRFNTKMMISSFSGLEGVMTTWFSRWFCVVSLDFGWKCRKVVVIGVCNYWCRCFSFAFCCSLDARWCTGLYLSSEMCQLSNAKALYRMNPFAKLCMKVEQLMPRWSCIMYGCSEKGFMAHVETLMRFYWLLLLLLFSYQEGKAARSEVWLS